ncbi:deoxynucleotide monophosphate kinase family protein [Streptomyces hydrogenans]|uniref:deoxynucleotide monophosphate kinase family protein n=1 Tax=Streptomyces hydrogenans TaxID=1873719 RepID=UPI0035DBB94B
MNIAIAGRARVGKDTVGEYLVRSRGYRRVAFADALKEVALRVNPIVVTDEDLYNIPGDRLSDVVGYGGWEAAKDRHPEVRRFLQELGAAMRAVDPEIWIRAALKKVDEANEAGVPCVVTDVRYLNELDELKRRRWHTVHINRPGVPQLVHESEGAIGPEKTHFMIRNVGTIDDLHRQVDNIMVDIDAIESARHYARL